jgi:hypothetical protein
MAPRTFPPNTLFVAVTERDDNYAGEDGGPQRGGIGRWRKGLVREWTANFPPPLAKRNPEDGLIHSGWLEVVKESILENGKRVCVESEKIYAEPRRPLQRLVAAGNAAGMADPTEPSERAVQRAVGGAGSMADALLPPAQVKTKPKVSARASAAASTGARD